jgi:hypothetical protein
VSPKIISIAAIVALALAGCGGSGHAAAPTRTVTHTMTVTPSPAPRSPSPTPTVTQTATPAPPPPSSPAGIQAVTPWAVVSEYYGDIESGDYPGAYALLSSGSVTGQTYQQFVNGFACTSVEDLSDLGTTGDTVTISLNATQCDGTVNSYQGTYTVQGGRITAADITQTG